MKIKNYFWFLVFAAGITMGAIPIKSFKANEDLPKTLDLDAVTNPQGLSRLATAKWHEINEDWQACLKAMEQIDKKSDIGLWLAVTHLKCLKNTYETTQKVRVQNLVNSFQQVESQKLVLMNSPFKGHKELLISVFLGLMKKSIENGRDVFDDFSSRNSDIVDQLNEQQRARYYKYMGELAWLRQKNELAKSNFLRSYSFSPDKDVLNRLKTLGADQFLRLEKYKPETRLKGEERQAWQRFYKSSEKGQTIKVVRGGVDFLNNYPGSTKADEVSRRIEIFFKRLLYRRGNKFESQKKAYISYMTKAPAHYLLEWAETAYERGYYSASAPLAATAAEKWEGRVEAAEALILAGRSFYNMSQWDEARSSFEALIQKHSGSEAYGEAQYLLGLMFYRQKKWNDVVATYDRFLLNESSDKWELQARYWLWRAMKKLESPRSEKMAEIILREFPLTYYGLKVRMETKGGLQTLLQKEKSDIKSTYWWTVAARQRWERIKKLLENGWIDEAEREMDLLPDPQLAQGYVVRAQVWKAAFRTRRAMQDYSDAVDKDPTFLTSSLIKMSFPQDFPEEVEKAYKEFSISQELIWAVMRQESAFNPRAVSPSRAYGLMQLLKPTMKETAKWLRDKKFRFQVDRFDPERNVRYGTHFLSRMIRKYKGVVPLAIASYNVGPGNLDRWIIQRKDLENWPAYDGDPDQEMWMDELPWGETSFYVKAVMRNFLLYRIIHSQYDKLETPSWSGAQDFYQVPKDI